MSATRLGLGACRDIVPGENVARWADVVKMPKLVKMDAEDLDARV